MSTHLADDRSPAPRAASDAYANWHGSATALFQCASVGTVAWGAWSHSPWVAAAGAAGSLTVLCIDWVRSQQLQVRLLAGAQAVGESNELRRRSDAAVAVLQDDVNELRSAVQRAADNLAAAKAIAAQVEIAAAEQDVKRSREVDQAKAAALRMTQALDATSIPVRIADADGTVLYINGVLRHIVTRDAAAFKRDQTDFDPERVVGRSIGLFYPDPAAAVAKLKSLTQRTQSRMVLGGRT